MTKIPDSQCSCRSINSKHYKRCLQFYTHVLAELGIRPLQHSEHACGFGKTTPGFWVRRQQGQHASASSNVYFQADSQEAVFGFFASAFEHGAFCLDQPETHHNGISCRIRDPEGNTVHVCFQPKNTSH